MSERVGAFAFLLAIRLLITIVVFGSGCGVEEEKSLSKKATGKKKSKEFW